MANDFVSKALDGDVVARVAKRRTYIFRTFKKHLLSMSASLYHQLLDTPDLKLLMNRVKVALEEEAKRREEFYEWVTPDIKAEFINGEIIMHSPVKRGHLGVSGKLFPLLKTYVDLRDLGEVDAEKALVSLTRNDYEPDICFWGVEKAKTFTEDTMKHPAPDFVVEILSQTTQHRDRGIKFQDYAAHGVKEYWIIDARARTIEPYVLDRESRQFEGGTTLTIKDVIHSTVIDGFVIPVKSVFDKASYLKTLRELMDA